MLLVMIYRPTGLVFLRLAYCEIFFFYFFGILFLFLSCLLSFTIFDSSKNYLFVMVFEYIPDIISVSQYFF